MTPRSRRSSPAGRRHRAAPRATALGFAADADIDEAVHAFIEDDLEMQKTLGLTRGPARLRAASLSRALGFMLRW